MVEPTPLRDSDIEKRKREEKELLETYKWSDLNTFQKAQVIILGSLLLIFLCLLVGSIFYCVISLMNLIIPQSKLSLSPGTDIEWELKNEYLLKDANHIPPSTKCDLPIGIKMSLKSFDLKVHGPHLTKIEFDLGLNWIDPRLEFAVDYTRNVIKK
jgi:hypothetical protein